MTTEQLREKYPLLRFEREECECTNCQSNRANAEAGRYGYIACNGTGFILVENCNAPADVLQSEDE